MSSDTLLLDLYACAAEPTRWPLVLDRLCAETGARSAVVQAFSFDGPRACIRWSALDSHTRRQQALYTARISDAGNPRLDHRRALRGLNRVTRDEELFDDGDTALTQLHGQLATLGLGRFAGALQPLDRDTYLGLALHRAVDDPIDFSGAQLARMATLAPHVRQAFALGDRLQAAHALDARLRQHFDRLRCGLIVCDGAAQVQWINRSAEQLLGAGGTLRVHAGRLQACSHGATEALRREIAAAQAAPDTTRYLALGDGAQAVHVAAHATVPPDDGAASVLLVVTAAQAGAGIPAGALARLFGLTPTESQLLVAMVGGSTVEQYAQRRGVSVGTARGQLKQVLAKTGSTRQAELVRLVLSSAAAQLVAQAAEHAY